MQSWIEPDHLEAGRRRADAEALNEPQQLHGLTVRPRATTRTCIPVFQPDVLTYAGHVGAPGTGRGPKER